MPELRPSLLPSLSLLAVVALSSSGCGKPEGSSCSTECNVGLECIAHTCRKACITDSDCSGEFAYCSLLDLDGESSARICLAEPTCEPGTADCLCGPSNDCQLGFACEAGMCRSAAGQKNQPCLAGGCDGDLECVEFGSQALCVDVQTGQADGPCLPSATPLAGLPRCRSDELACTDAVCTYVVGQLHQACRADDTCQDGYECASFGGAELCVQPGVGTDDDACLPRTAALSDLPPCRTPDLQCESDNMCRSTVGRENYACTRDGECDSGLECARFDGEPPSYLCVTPGAGTVGGACLDEIPRLEGHPRCRGVDLSCQLGTCLGRPGAACATDAQCLGDLACRDGECAAPPECELHVDCDVSELCCGDPSSPFADDDACGPAIGEYMCFEPPASIFDRSCTTDIECNPVDTYLTTYEGISACGFEGPRLNKCSVPCTPGNAVAECPNQWACERSFKTCFSNEDCLAEGLVCAGMDEASGRPGRCQCGAPGEMALPCTTTATVGPGDLALMADAECVGDGTGYRYCAVGFACTPPSN